MRYATLLLILLASEVLTHSVSAQVDFFGLGRTSFVSGISSDGGYLTGTFYPQSYETPTAFRWDRNSGFVDLGLFPNSDPRPYYSFTHGLDVSNDGTVVGYGTAQSGPYIPFRWDASSGYSYPSPNSPPYGGLYLTIAASDSAKYFNGSDVSANGEIVVGRSGSQASYWSDATGFVTLPFWDAMGISSNGNFIVGTTNGYGGLGTEAYRMDRLTGSVTLLGFVEGGSYSFATDVSSDGSVVVGISNEANFVWTEATGMLDLASVLDANGLDHTGWTLNTHGPVFITDDGRTIIGNGIGPADRNEVWVAQIHLVPEPTTAAALAISIGGLCVLRIRRSIMRQPNHRARQTRF